MYHGDPASTGQYLSETTLSATNVNSANFGLLYSYPVDGQVHGEPLYKSAVPITTGPYAGTTRNVVYVATENDSVCAFDADMNAGSAPLWQDSFINTANGVTPEPYLNSGGNIEPAVGITSTPVIDPSTSTLFVCALTKEIVSGSSHFVYTLHALDLGNGSEKPGSPTLIADTLYSGAGSIGATTTAFKYISGPAVSGTGAGAINGMVHFNALRQQQRSALALVNGNVYIAFGSFGDHGDYHGWILGYSATNYQITAAWNDTPNGNDGGIWEGGGGLPADSAGNIYCMTGNGSFIQPTYNAAANLYVNGDYGDSFVKLAVDTVYTSSTNRNSNGWGLKVVDYFTPYNQANLSQQDNDLGSGGPMLLPDTAGSTAHPHLLVGAGKQGTLYMVDRDHMGEYTSGTDSVVQELPGAFSRSYDTPAYFNGAFYYGPTQLSPAERPGVAFTVKNGAFAPAAHTPDTYGYAGFTPVISGAGPADPNAIVWGLNCCTALRACTAANFANEIYTSTQAPDNRDEVGDTCYFGLPTVANGRVYVPTDAGLLVYGLLKPCIPAPPTNLTATCTSGSTASLSWVDNSNNESGFLIEDSTNGTNFTQVASVGPDVQNYRFTGVRPGITYSFRVLAYNPAGDSAGTNVATLMTDFLAASTLDEGPAAGAGSVELTVAPATSTWTAVSDNSWLHVWASSTSGTGSATLFISFDANSGATRSGAITIAGQTLKITQAGSTYVAANDLTPLPFNGVPNEPGGVAVDGSGRVYIADAYNNAVEEYSPATQTIAALVSSGLNYPAGVALDGAGNVYIADSDNNAIKEYSPSTQALKALVSSGLKTPAGVAVDRSGNVYIADTGNNAIKKYSASANSVTPLVSSGLNDPEGVAVDSSGHIYIADTGNNAIKEYSPSTQAVKAVVSSGLYVPTGVAVDHSGHVFIADTSNNAIKEYMPTSGTVVRLVYSKLNGPEGVAVDGSGHDYIADTFNDAIKINSLANGTVTTLLAAVFNHPRGMAVDGSGNVYIANSYHNIINEYSPTTGTTTTPVPSGVSFPEGVALDGSGNIYIADSNDNAIKEYSPATQILSTLVGIGLNQPDGVALDSSGNVYIADTGNNAIKVYSPATQTVRSLVSTGLHNPMAVAVDAIGNVYIGDSFDNAIKEYSPVTQSVATLLSTSEPASLALDGGGNIYFGNGGTLEEYRAATKTVSTLFSSGLHSFSHVTVDGAGNVYFANDLGTWVGERQPAYLVPTAKSEPATAGSDAMPMVIPATVNLAGPFAPTSDQSWLTVGPVTGGVISFSFTGNSGPARTGHITVLGHSIPVNQAP